MIRIPGDNTNVSRDINRAFTATNTSAILYYSTMLNVVDATQLTSLTTPDYFMHFGQCSGGACTIFGARLGILATNGFANYKLAIENTSGGTPLYTFVPDSMMIFGQSYFVVVKYDRTTTPTTATLWVNPTSLGGAEQSTGFITNTVAPAVLPTLNLFVSGIVRVP